MANDAMNPAYTRDRSISNLVSDAIHNNTTQPELVPGQLINGSARDTQAALAREEWQDYISRFFPLEDRLLGQYDNKAMRDSAMAENSQAVNRAFDTDQGIQQRRLGRYGVTLADDQKAALDRQNQVARVATLTDVRNLTRDAFTDLDSQILTGSSASTAKIGATEDK